MKILLLALCLICLAATVNAAPNVRQRTKLYIKTGQLWDTNSMDNVPKTAPRWYVGGGARVGITEDQRITGNLELKNSIFNTDKKQKIQLDWSVSYSF